MANDPHRYLVVGMHRNLPNAAILRRVGSSMAPLDRTWSWWIAFGRGSSGESDQAGIRCGFARGHFDHCFDIAGRIFGRSDHRPDALRRRSPRDLCDVPCYECSFGTGKAFADNGSSPRDRSGC